MSELKPERLMEISFNGKDITENELEKAIANEDILCGRVEYCDRYGSLRVMLGNNCEVEIPIDKFDYRTNSPGIAQTYIGELVVFVVTSFNKLEEAGNCKFKCLGDRNRAQEIGKRDYVDKLKVGDIVEAYVNGVEKFGLFCDLAVGYIAVLPIERFSLSRVIDAKRDLDHLKVIKVIIANKCENGNVYVSHKELLGTWEEAVADFNPRDSVLGTVVNVVGKRLFISLAPNVVGIAATPEDGNTYEVGDVVAATIVFIRKSIMRVQLRVSCKKEGILPSLNIKYKYPGNHIDYWCYAKTPGGKEICSDFRQ